MLRLASLLMLVPVACLFGQAGTPVRVTIGDSVSADRFQIIRRADTSAAAGRLRGVGTASFILSTRDTSTITVLSEDSARPVHVRVSAPQGPLTAVGSMVMVHVAGDSVRIEARARP